MYLRSDEVCCKYNTFVTDLIYRNNDILSTELEIDVI